MADSVLGERVTIVMGQSPPGDTTNSLGTGLPLLNGPTEFGAHHPSPVQFTTDGRKLAQPGDLLFCVRGSTTGRMNWADREYAIGRGIAAIRHTDAGLQPLVRAVIEQRLPSLLAQATGSTFPNVSSVQLARIPWPPLTKHQERTVAHVLAALDERIEVDRRMNQTLEATARAIFKSWFVEFDPVRARAEGRSADLPKPIADLFPDMLWGSELGDVPAGWRIGRFDHVTEALREPVDPQASPAMMFRHYSIPAFDEGREPKTELGEAIKSLKWRVPSETVLMSKLNPEIERVWVPDIQPDDQAVCSTEFLVLRARPPFARTYLYCLARSPALRQQIEGLVTGTSKSHQRAQLVSILSLPVIVPPAPVIEAFEAAGRHLIDRSLVARRASRTVTAIRDALVPKLISGELSAPQGQGILEATPA